MSNDLQGTINFFSDGTGFELRHKTRLRDWLHMCAKRENRIIGEINYIFTSDRRIKKINREYLGHDYATDIITFPYHKSKKQPLHADVYISIDRIKENARDYGVRIYEELARVMVHGLLHLTGHKDRTLKQKELMRKIEDKYLSFISL